MAKSKSDLFKDAQAAGLVAEDADEEGYTAEQLRTLLAGDVPADLPGSSMVPLIAPDGHVTLSQEDIDARS